MQTMTHMQASFDAPDRWVRPRAWRVPRAVRIAVLAAATVAMLGLLSAVRPPGAAIRGDLATAAEALSALPSNAKPARVTAALRAAMRGRTVQVDPSGFPTSVARDLAGPRLAELRRGRASGAAPRRLGRVELQGFASPADCRASNDMTWRLMP